MALGRRVGQWQRRSERIGRLRTLLQREATALGREENQARIRDRQARGPLATPLSTQFGREEGRVMPRGSRFDLFGGMTPEARANFANQRNEAIIAGLRSPLTTAGAPPLATAAQRVGTPAALSLITPLAPETGIAPIDRNIRPLTSPLGLYAGAVAPGLVLGGTAGALGGSALGGEAERLGAPRDIAGTGIGTRTAAEIIGGVGGGGLEAAAGRRALQATGRNVPESLAALRANPEFGGTRLPGGEPPEGHIRLYRGVGASPHAGNLEDFATGEIGPVARGNYTGQFWTSNRALAESYAGPNGQVFEVDVPRGVAEQGQMRLSAGKDVAIDPNTGLREEITLPPEWATKTQPRPSGIGGEPPGTGGTGVAAGDEPQGFVTQLKSWADDWETRYAEKEAERHADRVQRVARFEARIAEEMAAGQDRVTATNIASQEFSGEYAGFDELPGLNLTPENQATFMQRMGDLQPFQRLQLAKMYERLTRRNPEDIRIGVRPFEIKLIREIYGEEVADVFERIVRVDKKVGVLRGRTEEAERAAGIRELSVTGTPEEINTPPVRRTRPEEPAMVRDQGMVEGHDVPKLQPENLERHTLLSQLFDALKIPQTIKQAFDLSLHMRQLAKSGFRHPGIWKDSFITDLKIWKDPEYAAMRQAEMLQDPTPVSIMTPDGIYNTTYGEVSDKFMRLHRSVTDPDEDFFLSRTAEKIPGIRRSELGFTTAGNQFRHDMARNWVLSRMKERGGTITQQELHDMGELAARLTGRGNVGEKLFGTKIAPILRTLGWAPGYRLSGPQAFGRLIDPKTPAYLRKIAAENLFSYMFGVGSIMGLAYASGQKVGINPRSSEFGKINIGKSSYNLWGTDAVLARYFYQFVTGQSETARPIKLPDGTTVTRKFDRGPFDWKALENYMRSGVDPLLGDVLNIAQGENILGEDVKPFRSRKDFIQFMKTELPLSLQDALREYELNDPVQATANTALTVLGTGVTTYDQRASQVIGAMPKYEGVSLEQQEKLYDLRQRADQLYEEIHTGDPESEVTKGDVARQLGEAEGDPELGMYLADLYGGNLSLNPERLGYIIDHQDELDPETLRRAIPVTLAREILTPENKERYDSVDVRITYEE